MQTNEILKKILIWGILAIPFIPMIVSTAMFFPFVTLKNFLFRFSVEILFGIWLVLMVRDASFRPRFSWILGALGIFLLTITVADIFGENFSKSFWSNFERMDGLITQIHLILYFLVITSVLKTEELWKRFFHISIGVSIFIGLYGLLQLLGEFVINQGGARVDSTLGNATYLASYLLFQIFFLVFWYVRTRRENPINLVPILQSVWLGLGIFSVYAFIRLGNSTVATGIYEKTFLVLALFIIGSLVYVFFKHRENRFIHAGLYSSIGLLHLVVLFYTASRGMVVGLVAGAFLGLIIFTFFQKGWGRGRKISAGFLIGIIVFIGIFLLVRDLPAFKSHPTLARFSNINLSEGQSRFLIWGMSLEGVKEKPILGWGQGNFNILFNKYYRSEMYNQEPWFDRAHNVVIDWLVAAGILGLLSYLFILGSTLFLLWRPGGNSIFSFSFLDKSILTGLGGAYFVQNLFVFDQIVSYILFFSILGFIHVYATSREDEDVLPEKEDQKQVIRSYVVISLVIVLLPFVIYSLNAKGYLANRTLLQALSPQPGGITDNINLYREAFSYDSFGTGEVREQLAELAVRLAPSLNLGNPALKEEITTLVFAELAKQIEKEPRDARSRLFFASTLLSYGQFEEAEIQLKESLEISPLKPQTYFLLMNVYLAQERYEDAFDVARTAYEFATTSKEAYRYYAGAATYLGRDDITDQFIADTDEENVPTEAIFINAYAKRGRYDRIAEIWKKRIVHSPNNPQLYFSLAATYLELSQREDAVETLEVIMERFAGEAKEQAAFFIDEIRSGRNPQEDAVTDSR